jgi:transposase
LAKKLPQQVEQLRQQYPTAEIQLWAMDEHRLGLKPLLRRSWVPWWDNPIAQVQWRYEWVWVYGFVHPATGETYWWILPCVNIDCFNRVLADFAQHFELGKDKHILLSVDQSGWHTSDKVELPEGLHLEFLPPYSPELQPAERLWPILDEPIANRVFEKIEELEQVLSERCCGLLKQRDFIRGLTHFHWWQAANA